MKSKHNDLEVNQLSTTMAIFMESYNKSLPAAFPQASAKKLKEFQGLYPILFKQGDEWSIDKHRKKVMDWLSSHQDA